VVLVLRQAQDEDHSQAQQQENLILSSSKDEVFGRPDRGRVPRGDHPRTSSRIALSSPSSVNGNILSFINCFITPIDWV